MSFWLIPFYDMKNLCGVVCQLHWERQPLASIVIFWQVSFSFSKYHEHSRLYIIGTLYITNRPLDLSVECNVGNTIKCKIGNGRQHMWGL